MYELQEHNNQYRVIFFNLGMMHGTQWSNSISSILFDSRSLKRKWSYSIKCS